MQRYKELNRWQREAQGISKWDQSHSHRPLPYVERFNPEGVGLTRGTSSFAWKWWHTQYPWLPNTPPEDYVEPQPLGIRPPSWDEEFTEAILSMTDDELRSYALDKLTEVIFNETQKDQYELRRLDFEGNPLSQRPEKRVMMQFVLEEESLRQRVIEQVVEEVFRLSPTSDDRKELKSVQNIIDFVATHVMFARLPPSYEVTEASKAVMRSFPVQPLLGFEHALPSDNRDAVVKGWERMHHADWQFGNAVYTPRSTEDTRGNFTWLRDELHHAEWIAFQQRVESGEAKEKHLLMVKAAGGTV